MAQYKDKTGQVWAYDRREGGYQRVVDGKPDDSTTIQSLEVLEHAWGPLELIEETGDTRLHEGMDGSVYVVRDEEADPEAQRILDALEADDGEVTSADKHDRLKALNTAISTSVENLARMGYEMGDSAFFAVRLEAVIDHLLGAMDGDDTAPARMDFELDFATMVHQMMRNTLAEAQSRKARDSILRPDGSPFRR